MTSATERRWESDSSDLRRRHPRLALTRHARTHALITGQIELIDPGGRSQFFDLCVRYPGRSPYTLPDAYDPAGRFGRTGENHVESDGRFCMWLPQDAPVSDFCRPGGLLRYLEMVREFLLLQLVFEARRDLGMEPRWPGAEWKHGDRGHEEWFRETTASLSPSQFEALLVSVNADVPRPGRRCPCGSGKRLAGCHKEWIKRVRRAVRCDHGALRAGWRVLDERRG